MGKRLAGLVSAAVVALTAMNVDAGYVMYTFEGHVDKGLLGGDPLGIQGQDFSLQFWAENDAAPTSTGINNATFAAQGLLTIGGVASSIFDAEVTIGEIIVPILWWEANLEDYFSGLSTNNFTFPADEYGGLARIDAALDPDAFNDVDDLPLDISDDFDGVLGQLFSAVPGSTLDQHYWLHTTDVSSTYLNNASSLPSSSAATPAPEPGTLALMSLGGLGLLSGAIRKRRKSAAA